MNIKGLNKATVLSTLYNASRHQGMGWLHADGVVMTDEEAQKIIDSCNGDLYFDYLKGKVMKIDIGKDELNTRLYNRDNGDGAAEEALSVLFK